VAIAGVDEQARAVRFVYRSVCVGLFEPRKPPSPNERVLDLLLGTAFLTTRK